MDYLGLNLVFLLALCSNPILWEFCGALARMQQPLPGSLSRGDEKTISDPV